MSSALAGEFFITEPPGKPIALFTEVLFSPSLLMNPGEQDSVTNKIKKMTKLTIAMIS